MNRKTDYVYKHFKTLKDKTLENALAHHIHQHFPRIGGPRIRTLCAQMVLEVVAAHLRPRAHVRHGQVLWLAYSVDDPPRRNKRTADSEMVPVLLDLSTAADIDARLARESPRQRRCAKVVRLCHQAFEQGGLLSNCDLSELLGIDDGSVAGLLADHEKRTGKVVPRRATVHDVGSGQTHKLIICRKRYLEGKPPEQVARETYHTLEAVDRYLGAYDRVRHCRQEGLSPEAIAYTLDHSRALIDQYLAIDDELEHDDA
jgi:hypothetical protein